MRLGFDPRGTFRDHHRMGGRKIDSRMVRWITSAPARNSIRRRRPDGWEEFLGSAPSLVQSLPKNKEAPWD
jgi:hypothetical protein